MGSALQCNLPEPEARLAATPRKIKAPPKEAAAEAVETEERTAEADSADLSLWSARPDNEDQN